MKFELKEISGVKDAILALFFSKGHYTDEIDREVRETVETVTGRDGKVIVGLNDIAYMKYCRYLYKLAKYGTGFDMSNALTAGHDTLLRFIDFSIVVRDLHRGAMDDFDAHAMRMNNRIVRTSTRLGGVDALSVSDYYDGAIKFPDQLMDLPDTIEDGETYVKIGHGYVKKSLAHIPDVVRGLTPLAANMSCICQIDFYDMRHIYACRNEYSKAHPELKLGIESLATQIEKALPILGKLIRNDCALTDTGLGLCHVANISKIDNTYLQHMLKSGDGDHE